MKVNILEVEDSMKRIFTKEDLRTGDVVKQRDGLVQIFIKELDVFVCDHGYNDADNVNPDLTHKYGHKYDIVAVRRPNEKSDCQFGAFDHCYGSVVYEYEEPVEMTLAEVCELLGKNIKIIK